jgi:hypothetical protein
MAAGGLRLTNGPRQGEKLFGFLSCITPLVARFALQGESGALYSFLGLPFLARLLGLKDCHWIAVHVRFESG